MSVDNEFLEFNDDGIIFVLSQYKIGLIYKYFDDLKDYWSLPIQNRREYRIQPSNVSKEWRVNKILGYKLIYLLRHITEINEQLIPKYRANASIVRTIGKFVKKQSSILDSSGTFEMEDELYRWQEEALNTWYSDEGKRGIIEAATGTGKTRLAFACMRKFFEDSPNGIVSIVVPKQPLFDQWQENLHDNFRKIPDVNYCYIGNGYNGLINNDSQIIITTQQAMILKTDGRYGCSLLKKLKQCDRDVLIIVDEAHHLGAKSTIDRFVTHIPEDFYTLGLTATPDRRDGTMDKVYQYFDCPASTGPIYSYSVSEAVEEEVLCKVIQKNYKVSLNSEERQTYKKYCDQISDLKNRIANNGVIPVDKEKVKQGSVAYLSELERELSVYERDNAKYPNGIWDIINKIRTLKSTYINRCKLFNKAEEKWELLNYLLSEEDWEKQFTNGRWIFFHQEIEECEKTADLLKKFIGPGNIRLHHSEMTLDERQYVLSEFEKDQFNCLCAVQTLDEGLDIPDLKGVVIVSGSSSKRQQIQRCGRALRNHPNKDCACLVILLAQVDRDLSGERLLIGPNESTNRWVIEEYNYSA